MFHQGSCHPVFRIVPLQSFYISLYHTAIKPCVFSITFFCSSPTRITANICIGSSYYEGASLILITLKNVPCFISFGCSYLPYQPCIPGFGKAVRLRESGCRYQLSSAPIAQPS